MIGQLFKNTTRQSHSNSVADLDPVESGPFWSDPYVLDRIRIIAFIIDPISTFIVCVKTIET
jgi:hypothetical protein